MAYTGPYSLSHRLLTEFLATLLALFTGLSLLANELLPKTKGHGLGFFGVAFGFGLAFGTAIAVFSYASAHLNPAMALALWIIGELSFVEMLATVAVEMVAGFVAGQLLRTRDSLSKSALRIASYRSQISTAPPISDQIRIAKYYLHLGQHAAPIPRKRKGVNVDDSTETLMKAVFGEQLKDLEYEDVPIPFAVQSVQHTQNQPSVVQFEDVEAGPGTKPPDSTAAIKRRHSIQVADLHRKLERMDKILLETQALTREPEDTSIIPSISDPSLNTASTTHQPIPTLPPAKPSPTAIPPLTKAAIIADQNTKLSIFCTRPAIWILPHNFLVELIGTCMLIFAALGIQKGFTPVGAIVPPVGKADVPVMISLLVMLCVLSLGGPTGFAANPARDLAPRFAHYVLPIAGKGPSEWQYGLVQSVAMLLGGAMGGGLYLAVKATLADL
ncbi:hypothetical protein HK097_007135 [Rhizophlyctis rosea]|uniref:Aquaporin n=1 Tax=Rhizophlyctis rosea TaxID=64517 RepID=A0AAD5SCE0_9FUNG|nr:hypothetical protein HK097_007135 [Rhizophlyctis rosea]